jgi:hypothetical protein
LLSEQVRVYMGKSVEGVLRHRSAAELTTLFRHSYVCIRRFRATDCRHGEIAADIASRRV